MKKNVFGRKLSRDTNERKALFKSLLSSLVLHHRIRTTEAKAKAIKGTADKVVTLAKRNSHLLLRSYLTKEAIHKFISEIAPRFAQRQGGYTRIIRLEKRLSDDAQMVLIEWVEEIANRKSQIAKGEEKKDEKTSAKTPAIKKPRTTRKIHKVTKETTK